MGGNFGKPLVLPGVNTKYKISYIIILSNHKRKPKLFLEHVGALKRAVLVIVMHGDIMHRC